MTKADIATKILHKNKSLNKPEIKTIVDALFSTIQDSVAARQTIYIRGFGNFYPKHRAQRRARNVKKNLEIQVEAYDYPAFKPSKEFIKKLNRPQS